MIKFFALTALIFAVTACGGVQREAPDANPTPADNAQGPGLFSGESGNLADAFASRGRGGDSLGLPINAFLWRAALETVSFLPLKEVDSTGGVITTGYGISPNNANERAKINVLVLGRALSPQSLQVQVFTQQKQGEVWVDTPTDPAVTAALEDTILTAARKLRIRENAAR